MSLVTRCRVLSMIGVVAVFLLATVVTLSIKVAFAGSNGQQISFSCPTDPYGNAMMSYGIVRGNNQNGQSVEWRGYPKWGTGATTIFTQGWWWVGNVRIYWWNASTNVWRSTQVYVPKQQNGDISFFQCPPL